MPCVPAADEQERRNTEDGRHDRPEGVGFLPVETEQDRAEEGTFQTAHGEQVDPDDGRRWFDNEGHDDQTDDQSGEHGDVRDLLAELRQRFLFILHNVVQIDVLDDRCGCQDQQRRDGRHDRCKRRRDEQTRYNRMHVLQHDLGHNVVSAVERSRVDDGRCEDTGDVHDEHQEADDDRAVDDRIVQRLCVFKAHTADRCLRQTENTDTDEHPEGHDVRFGCCAAGGDVRIVGGHFLQLGCHGIEAARLCDDRDDEDDRAEDHNQALDRIRRNNSLEAADRRVDDDDDAEQDQSVDIGQPCDRLEQDRPA